MDRTGGIVDSGIWKTAFRPRRSIIPLDTLVRRISLGLQLTQQRDASLKTALGKTEALSPVFPGDFCLGDLALFGYDINKKKE